MGNKVIEKDIPADMMADAEKYHGELIERIVEQDEDVMNKYLEGVVPDFDTLKKLLRKGVIANEIFPVFAGSALKNKGVQLVLDAVVDYLPAPTDIPAIKGINPDNDEAIERHADDKEPFFCSCV